MKKQLAKKVRIPIVSFAVPWQSGPMQKPAKLYNRGFESHRYLIIENLWLAMGFFVS